MDWLSDSLGPARKSAEGVACVAIALLESARLLFADGVPPAGQERGESLPIVSKEATVPQVPDLGVKPSAGVQASQRPTPQATLRREPGSNALMSRRLFLSR